MTNLEKVTKKIRESIEKWVLIALHKTGALEFRTWKSPVHCEQYTEILFFGKSLKKITWSQLDIINRPKT